MSVPENVVSIEESWAGSGSPARTKSEIVYARLRRSILENELEAGTVLDQGPLARSLGVSPTPVREALRRLEAERLVVSEAHRESVVAPVTAEFVAEIYQVRLALDPLAARLAATQASQEQLDSISSFREGPPKGSTAIERFHFSRHLHRAIYSASGNSRLVDILEQLWDVSDRRRFATLKSRRAVGTSQNEHVRIIDAILARDHATAEDLMYQHVRSTHDAITDRLGPRC
jgi:DNA-binding GntR family transcriptional regulator